MYHEFAANLLSQEPPVPLKGEKTILKVLEKE
jgi:hypothetical protein